MAISDILKGIFLNRDNNKESQDYGATGLPRNVEEDLLRGSHPHDINAENTEPSGTFYFDFYSQNEPNPTSPHTHHHFEEHRDQDVFSFEQQMMSELDNMMKNMFGGMDRNMFHSFPHDSDSPKEDYIMISPPDSGGQSTDRESSLRDKMLGGNENKQKQQHLAPFSDENDQVFSFGFHPPSFFKDFFNDSFMIPSSPEFINRGHGQYEDRDLDKDIASGKQSLDDILGRGDFTQTPEHPRLGVNPPGEFSSMFKYSSTTRRMNPDGSVETVTTRKDSDGNEETTTTRSLDGQTHSVTQRKDKNGIEERKEDIVNMDEGDLQKFEERWKGKSQSDTASPRNQVLSPFRADDMNETIDNWKDYLSSWWNSKL